MASEQARGGARSQASSTAATDSVANKRAAAARKQAEVPIFQKRNWLLYHSFVRQKYERCREIIQLMKEETHGHCEYGLCVEGLLLRVEGKVLQSLECFRKASQLNPLDPGTKKQIAASLFLLGRHRQAVEAYDAAEELDKTDWEIRHNKGMCYVFMQEHKEAREQFLKAIQYNQALVTFKQLGALYEQQSEEQNAVDLYERGLQLYPDNTDLLTRLGEALLKMGNPTAAFEKLGSAVMFGSTSTQALMGVGSIMQQHGDIDPALDKYALVANTAPESPYLWNNLGMCYYAKSQWATAIACLKRAVYLAPLEWKINYNLGLVHLTMQQDTTAFHFLKTAIHLNSKSPMTYMMMAVAMTRLNEVDHAEKCYEKLFKLSKDIPLAYLNYATLLMRRNNHEEAAKQLKLFYECCQAVGEQASQLKKDAFASCKAMAGVLQMEQTAPVFQREHKRRRKEKEQRVDGETKASRRLSGQAV